MDVKATVSFEELAGATVWAFSVTGGRCLFGGLIRGRLRRLLGSDSSHGCFSCPLGIILCGPL